MKVLILANNDVGLYKFRKELIDELLHPGSFLESRIAEPCEVFISLPDGDFVGELVDMGCHYIDTPFERHGINPISELKLIFRYKQIIREIQPDIVFSYTIKPNIYGGIACKALKIPCIMNITGLGTAVENGGIMQKITLLLYRLALPGAKKVFFQNSENERFFSEHGLAAGKHDLLPGSGVNVDHYSVLEYPPKDTVEFVFISRIMKEKGIDQYLEAAKVIRKKYPQTRFHICGACEPEYDGELQKLVDDNTVVYHGLVKDVAAVHKVTHCTVHPTYYPEGMSNVLLEACASGRPIITTDRAGCREIIDESINGFVVKPKDSNDLIKKLEMFINLPYEQKKAMGVAARAKVETEFNRQIVVRKYVEEMEQS
jgi:glycosyltransferase involved in cell wall biosynthesis